MSRMEFPSPSPAGTQSLLQYPRFAGAMPGVLGAVAGYWLDMASDERPSTSGDAVEQQPQPRDREITIVTFRNCRGEVVCLDW